MAEEAGPDSQRVGGTALKLPQKVCPVEAAKPLPDAQGSGPGAPQFRGQLRPRRWHWLAQSGHILLLTGNQLGHQALLGTAGTTEAEETGRGRGSTPRNGLLLSCWGAGPASGALTGLGSHLMLRLRSMRGVPTPQGPSGPPDRPSSTCSRGEHVLSTTSVLVTSRPRISTVLGGLPSASGSSSGSSSSPSSPQGAREQWDGAASGPGLPGSSRELRLGEGLWGPRWAPALLALSARRLRWSRGLASSPSCC